MKPISLMFIGAVVWATVILRAQNSGQAPLPAIESVLQQVLERNKMEIENDRRFNERYAYAHTKLTEHRNSRGELKKREEKKTEHKPKAVPPALGAGQTDSDTQAATNVRKPTYEKNDFPLSEELLKRFHFTLAGRDIVNGRPALILDFVPAGKSFPERNYKDRFINRAAGRVWVDEAEAVLVKGNLRLTEKVNVVRGLAGTIWKFNFGFNRQRMPDGLWFTRDTDWHLEGREFFTRKTIDQHEEKADVRASRSPALLPVK